MKVMIFLLECSWKWNIHAMHSNEAQLKTLELCQGP